MRLRPIVFVFSEIKTVHMFLNSSQQHPGKRECYALQKSCWTKHTWHPWANKGERRRNYHDYFYKWRIREPVQGRYEQGTSPLSSFHLFCSNGFYNWNDICKPTSNSHSKPSCFLLSQSVIGEWEMLKEIRSSNFKQFLSGWICFRINWNITIAA